MKIFVDMNAQKKVKVFVLFLFLIVSVLGIGLYFAVNSLLQKYREEKLKIKAQEVQALLTAVGEVQKRWQYGDIEDHFSQNKFICKDLLPNGKINQEEGVVVGDYYLRCNPNYIQCYYSGKAGNPHPQIEVTYNQRSWTAEVLPLWDGKYYKRAYYQGKNGILINLALTKGKSNLNIFLEDTCREIYLPKRTYAYSLFQQENDWVWDNFDQDIFVDKFPVSHQEVKEWAELSQNKQILSSLEKKQLTAAQLSLPATGLNLDEMRSFCAFKGKDLMEAKIYDAASFYITDLDEFDVNGIERSPYPWEKHPSSSFLTHYRQLHENKQAQAIFSAEECELVYHRECKEKFHYPYTSYSLADTSWMGMGQMLGGYMEAMDNELEPAKNVKVSSFYFPANSSWHFLGLRAYWDGIGNSKEHFAVRANQDIQHYDVTFRCMKKITNALAMDPMESPYKLKLNWQKELMTVDHFKDYFSLQLFTTYKVDVKNWELVNAPEPVLGPDHTWQEIARFKTLGDDLSQDKDFCLFYQFPSRKIYEHNFDLKQMQEDLLGQLKMVEVLPQTKCADVMMNANKDNVGMVAIVQNIYLTQFFFDKKEHEFLIKVSPFDFKQQAILPQKMSFSLWNHASSLSLKQNEKDILTFKNFATENKLAGTFILKELDFSKTPEVAKRKQSLLSFPSERLQGKSRPQTCGGKNEKPCLRGRLFPEGHCQMGLKVFDGLCL